MIKEQDNKDVTTVYHSQAWMKLDWALAAGAESSENGRGRGRKPSREARVRSGMWDRQTAAHREDLRLRWMSSLGGWQWRKDRRQVCISAPRLLLGRHPVQSKHAEAAGQCLHGPDPESGSTGGALRKPSSECVTHAPLKHQFHFPD